MFFAPAVIAQENAEEAEERRSVGPRVRGAIENTVETVQLETQQALEEVQTATLDQRSALAGTELAPLTQRGRLYWATYSTVGPPNLAGGLIKAGYQTLINDPEEYGPHWEGYGKRYALRLPGIAVSNLMEAEIGALWGEDPRYHFSSDRDLGGRVWHVVKGTVTATNRTGREIPAYARLIAVPASNVISNAWRPESQHDLDHNVGRIAFGLLSRMASNAFYEFWPDVKNKFFGGD